MIELDEHGQPTARGFHHGRLIGRSADELIGICKGVLADGHIDLSEARFILSWMETNADYVKRWPFDHLYARVSAMLADGDLTPEEQSELLQLLAETCSPTGTDQGENAPCESLCDVPAPTIVFAERTFVVTGKFVSGPRREIEGIIESRGGAVAGAVSKKVSYLLIGSHGSRDWLHSNLGTKIEAAAELKRSGVPIAVIAERHFLQQLGL